MTPEVAVYAQELGSILAEHRALLASVDSDRLNSRLTREGNSPLAIAAHVAGCTRAWVLGLGCGLPVGRDRPAEFAAAGRTAEPFIRDLDLLSREVETGLGRLL